jgi:hypothetical protein
VLLTVIGAAGGVDDDGQRGVAQRYRRGCFLYASEPAGFLDDLDDLLEWVLRHLLCPVFALLRAGGVAGRPVRLWFAGFRSRCGRRAYQFFSLDPHALEKVCAGYLSAAA